jgi:hypothetical protein
LVVLIPSKANSCPLGRIQAKGIAAYTPLQADGFLIEIFHLQGL